MASEIYEVHLKATEQYLDAARRCFEHGLYFASVLLAATGAERAAMAVVELLGARPAIAYRHHAILRELEERVPEGMRRAHRDATLAVANLMGHLTRVRYAFRLEDRLVTPSEVYGRNTAEDVLEKAAVVLKYARLLRERLH